MIFEAHNNLIYCKGLDDPEKIKSFEANYIWAEELTEFTEDEFKQLNLRLRKKNDRVNQFYGSCNPISSLHWIKKLIDTDSSIAVHKSNYKMNPFLDKLYKGELEKLRKEDMNYYRIYTLGEWGVLENIIFTNWTVNEYKECPIEIYGLDFGYENPTALIKVGINENNLYLKQMLYQRHMTNSELIDFLKTIEKHDIYADSAEPNRIEEIHKAGFNIYPSNKDILLGIDLLKRYQINIDPESVDTIKEFQGYSRKQDKNGQVLEEPVKFNDHSIDAIRYAIFTLMSKKKARLRVI